MRVSLAFILLFITLGACSTLDRRTEEDDFQNFLRVVERADEERYTPYWLGKNPTLAGIVFYGPSMPDFETEINGRIDFSYDASMRDGGGSLNVSLISGAIWDETGFSRPIRDPVVKTIDVEVLGASGKINVISAGARPINATRLTVQIGETHVVVTAQAGGQTAPGQADSNPLIYEDAFMSVIEELRPYTD
jgi:hypothetical protein